MLHAVVMAGGSGTRFWPKSRRARPKQLIQFSGERSLLAETFERLRGIVPASNVWVVTTADLGDAIRKELPELPEGNLLAEPAGRDTAAAIGVAAAVIARRSPEAVLAVVPSDHTIAPAAKFQRALREAAKVAETSEYLLTFAIRPTYPATGYGYIEKGRDYDDASELPVFHVQEFTEKPDLATAKRYLRQGRFFWNSGIFVWRAKRILEEIQKYLPVHAAGIEEIAKAWGTPKARETLERVYPSLKKVSIDYGVMEPAAHAGQVLMMPADFHWDDVGSWTSLSGHLPPDREGNVSQGTCVVVDSTGNVISTEGDHLVAALGVQDLVIVHTGDATLVTTKEKAQEIKKLIARLEEKKLDQYL